MKHKQLQMSRLMHILAQSNHIVIYNKVSI